MGSMIEMWWKVYSDTMKFTSNPIKSVENANLAISTKPLWVWDECPKHNEIINKPRGE